MEFTQSHLKLSSHTHTQKKQEISSLNENEARHGLTLLILVLQ